MALTRKPGGKRLEGRQAALPRPESGEEFLGAVEALTRAGLELVGGFSLALLPGRGPEPRLRRVDDLLRAKTDALGRQLDGDRIPLGQVGGLPDLCGNRQLAALS